MPNIVLPSPHFPKFIFNKNVILICSFVTFKSDHVVFIFTSSPEKQRWRPDLSSPKEASIFLENEYPNLMFFVLSLSVFRRRLLFKLYPCEDGTETDSDASDQEEMSVKTTECNVYMNVSFEGRNRMLSEEKGSLPNTTFHVHAIKLYHNGDQCSRDIKVITNVSFTELSVKMGALGFSIYGFGHFLDRFFGFCAKKLWFFDFGVCCDLRFLCYFAHGFRLPAKMRSGFRI